MDHGAKLTVKSPYGWFYCWIKTNGKEEKKASKTIVKARNVENHELSSKIKIECTGKYIFLQKTPITWK